MKKLHLNFILFISLILLMASCKKDNPLPDVTADNANKYVNNWIYENMNTYYFWEDKIPTSPDYTLTPDKFFNSLLYKYDKNTNPTGDRFSWIQENYQDLLNSLSGVSSDEIGFDYIRVRANDAGTQYYLLVTYPKKGTDAYSKGIKRGDFIVKIDDNDITSTNYKTIVAGTGTKKLSIANWVYNSTLQKNELKYIKDVIVNMQADFAENPICMDSVYNIGGKNIGYLVYNFFARDKGDNTHDYDKQLMSTLDKLKTKGATEFILDLRYNSGGAVSTAIALASALVKDRTANKLFTTSQYNPLVTKELQKEYGTDFNKDFFIDKIEGDNNVFIADVPALNLPRLYVLTGNYTASASELIINGLKPYMNVFLIGGTTYGKNVGSISIYEKSDPKNKWGLQPIVVKYFNSANQSDYTAGFTPDVAIDEFADLNLVEFGNTKDPLLAEAIKQITGISTAAPVRKYAKGMTSSQADIQPSLYRDKNRFDMVDDRYEKAIRKLMK